MNTASHPATALAVAPPTIDVAKQSRFQSVLIVAACAIVSLCGTGAISIISIFITPLEQTFGWNRSQISATYGLMSLGAAIGGIVLGALTDRFGIRWIAAAGAAILSGGLYALAFQNNLLVFYAICLVMGAAGLAAFHAPIIALVGSLFGRRRGLAVGIVTGGGALGQGLVPLIAGVLITKFGWQAAYQILAAGYAALLIPSVWIIAQPRKVAVPISQGGERHAWPMTPASGVVILSIAAFFCCTAMAVPLVHVMPMLIGKGFDTNAAARIMMVVMMTAACGRIVFGFIADRFGALRGYIAASAIQTASLYFFVPMSTSQSILFVAIIFGFGFSGVMTSLVLCVRQVVPTAIAGRSTAIVSFVGWLGMGFGGFAGGHIFHMAGSYPPAFAFAVAFGVINLAILITLAMVLRARGYRPPARGLTGIRFKLPSSRPLPLTGKV